MVENVARIEGEGHAFIILEDKSEGKRYPGRPWHRWDENVRIVSMR